MSRINYNVINKESDIKIDVIKKIIDIKIEVIKCIDDDVYIKDIDAMFKLQNDIMEWINRYTELKRGDYLI